MQSKQPSTRRQKGQLYESEAAEWLETMGFEILERNRTYPWGEIDIIAEDLDDHGPVLVFIEVRGGSGVSYVKPQESLGLKKQQRLLKAIETYLLHYRGPAANIRIDLITVGDVDRYGGIPIQHYPDFIRLWS